MITTSIIIPTFNRCEYLARALLSLIHQGLPEKSYEIIIIDNGSTDCTRETAGHFVRSNRMHRIRYFRDEIPGLLTGRHRGALEARSEILCFVDDDIEADQHWLHAIIETFEDPTVQLVGGPSVPRYALAPPPWLDAFWWLPPDGGRACGHLSLLDLGGTVREIDANYIWGLNLAIRRRTLFALGGFHPDIVPKHLQHLQGDGETGLTLKAKSRGFRAVYQPAALVHHRIPQERLTVQFFCQRSYYQGVCDSYTTIRRNGGVISATEVHLENSVAAEENTQLEANESVDDVKAVVAAAYRAGYAFHQNAVRCSCELLKWVLRDNYWNYELPQITRSRFA